MKSLWWKLCLMAGISCLMLFGNARPVLAAEDSPAGPDERLQRLERRLNELAEHQQQMMRRLDAAQGHQGAMPAPGFENRRPLMPPPEANLPLVVRINRLGDMVRMMLLGFIVCNVLLAIWIFTDIRKRGEGSGIFIALALLAGIPAAIIYSLVRIGDKAAVAGK